MKAYNVRNKKGKLIFSTVDKFDFYSFVLSNDKKDYFCQIISYNGKLFDIIEKSSLIPIKDVSKLTLAISKIFIEEEEKLID